ncbi:uncharacterized protein LOC131218197 [Magnolia sinica]|uniref:uncharacterized protein LOC131218197 n=1 Tax=Magnolia sinica TaxID=86752 RepID=UPI00265A7349|nr:uncharacterized protein LOC131218197 [Magnolia sinica]
MGKMRKLKRKTKDVRNKLAYLPTEILVTILMRLDLVDCIRAGVVCSSWRAAWTEMVTYNLHPPSHQLPLLILPPKNQIHRVFNLLDKKVYELHLSQASGARCLGSFNGWLILMDEMSNGCFLLNVTSNECISLPRQADIWNSTEHQHFVWNSADHHYVEHFWESRLGIYAKAILSSDPTSGDCIVVIVCSMNTFAFCRVGDAAWTALERKPNQRHCISDITFYNGRLIIVRFISRLEIFELDLCPNSAKWKPLLIPQLEYPHNSGVGYARGIYLVESCGELLMVLRIYYCLGEYRPRSRLMTTFCLFKMDTNSSGWIKVESLGDQMLFLGYPKSIPTKGLSGFKRNCIYFTKDICIWNHESGVFDLEDGSIWPFPSSIPSSIEGIYHPTGHKPIWAANYNHHPGYKCNNKKEQNLQSNESTYAMAKAMGEKRLDGKKKGKRWTELPTEILVTILMRLFLVDCIRAGAVCISWRRALSEIVARKLHPPSHQLPWLIVSRKNEIHRVLNLSDNKVFRLDLSQACGAICLGSFNGWLILKDKWPNGCFLLNVISKECIRLPLQANIWNSAGNRYVKNFWEQGLGIDAKATLSSDPNSGDCTVVIDCSRNRLAFCKVGDAAWTTLEGEPDQYCYISDITVYNGRLHIARSDNQVTIYEELVPRPNSAKWSDITVYNGRLHIASYGNQVTVYEELVPRPKLAKWKTLPPPEIESLHHDFDRHVYLVESCGDLLMVVRIYDEHGRHSTAFRIFKMNTSGSCWIKVESLGDQMLFLAYSNSKSVSAKGLPGFKGNCIYFTKDIVATDNDSGVFDLEDGSIKPFTSSISSLIPYLPIWVTPYPM